MEKLRRIFKSRIIWLVLLMVIALGAVVYRLYVLQIKENDKHALEAKLFSTYQLPVDAPRGNIYDRNGVLLATNRTAYKLYMISTDDDQAYRDEMYLQLVNLMDENNDVYYNYLADYITYPLGWGVKLTEGEDSVYNKKAWINAIVTAKSDKDYFDTPENAFNYLRYTVFDISDEYTDSEAYKIMIFRYNWYMYGLDTLKPAVFATDVSKATIDAITARSTDFRGVTSEVTYYRTYVNCESLGSIVGYVRAIDEEEFEEKEAQGYYRSDVIGKLGIEQICEEYLRGTRGHRDYEKDTRGNVTETGYTPPVPGCDVYLTIDVELQQVLYESIEKNAKRVSSEINYIDNWGDCDSGAGIVSDVNTGDVLAMVSYPSFDNNIYVARADDAEAQAKIEALLNDPNASGVNRAAMSAYPIGSMIKPVIAVAGLESGVTDETRTVYCPGYIVIAGRRMKCLGVHNDQDLKGAMQRSCNCYYAQIGVDAGIENVDKWIRAFGLGEYTGLEISEAKGTRSNPQTMDIFEAGTFHKWSDASTAATSIGQLYTTFTPIQVNRYYAAIANGGYLNEMHLLKKIVDTDGSIIFETEVTRTKIDVSEKTLKIVKDAMNSTVDLYADLQRTLSNYPKRFIAGKTGTAQTGTNEQSSHAFYSSYVPANDPQISMTLLLEHGVQSVNTFSSVRDICDCYFGGSYTAGFKGETDYYDTNSVTYPSRSVLAIIRER